MFRFASAWILVLAATSAFAQDQADPDPLWQFWVKGQTQHYANFFQRAEGQAQDDVQALYGEAGASVTLSRTAPLRAYGNVNVMQFSESDLSTSPGIRVGLRLDGRPHAFDVRAEQLLDRPSFDIGDEFDRADITNLAGEYSYRVTRDWQVSLEGEYQKQDIEVTTLRDNDFLGAGAAVRWRGSRLFSPEIGFRSGRREVEDDTLSYDQDEMYLQIRSAPTPEIYISARYRDRGREYTSGREDDRRQITASVDWSMTPTLIWNFYGSHETVKVNRAGRDFDTALYILGITKRF